jgi:hypothetical protein
MKKGAIFYYCRTGGREHLFISHEKMDKQRKIQLILLI